MSNPVKDQLWRLVKSLNKSEKRNFKLFATRAGATQKSRFIQLFDLLDKLDDLDDSIVMQRLHLTKGKYSNLKRHLFQQVLASLRLIHIDKEVDIELREQIDFSRILYGKGHYLDALRLLERAKAKAVEHNQDLVHLQIVEFQKLIEARHVTHSRQVRNKMDLLLNESSERCYSVLTTSELFSMNIQIHGRYIESGHSRDEREYNENVAYWNDIQTVRSERTSITNTFHQQINRFQASMWYHYIQLNFEDSLEAAYNAINLFNISRHMTVKDPDLYLRCIYYVGVFAFLNEDLYTLRRYNERLEAFITNTDVNLNENSVSIGTVYLKLNRYNQLFMEGDHAGAYAFSRRIAKGYRHATFRPAEHRWGQFLYKAAAAAFLTARYEQALDHLNEIINTKLGVHRQDLIISTRVLHALCNYELGHYSLVEYHLTNLSRLLRRSQETAEVHRITVAGLRKLIGTPALERAEIFTQLLEDTEALRGNVFERKALIYLDTTQWLRLHTEAGLPQPKPSR